MATIRNEPFSRRECLRMGMAGLLGVSYSGWLSAMARASVASGRGPRACILLWMNGGPSQLETFDPKPGADTGGPIKAIETASSGVRISELLPKIARQTNRMAIIRGMTSKEGDHGRASFLMRTGYRPMGAVRYPTLGSVVAKELGRLGSALPNFVSISPFRFFGANDGPGFLGPAYGPLAVGTAMSFRPEPGEALAVDDLAPAGGFNRRTLESRYALRQFIQSEFQKRHPNAAVDVHRANYEQATQMVLANVESVFDLSREPVALRDAYGRNRFGQGCLLARRLIERGVPFVEVTLANIQGTDAGWDTHINNFEQVRQLCQVLDPAWSMLMDDLESRGLLDSTLVVWMGEFGRTPVINGFNGRDHYPDAWSTVLAGGGIHGGQVVGDTGKSGMKVENRPVTVSEFLATICVLLGIDYAKENHSDDGRPIPIVERGGKPMPEIVATA